MYVRRTYIASNLSSAIDQILQPSRLSQFCPFYVLVSMFTSASSANIEAIRQIDWINHTLIDPKYTNKTYRVLRNIHFQTDNG